jgi:hypothetical protein
MGRDGRPLRSRGGAVRAGLPRDPLSLADVASILAAQARRAPARRGGRADFADASWLLGCELWGGLPVTVNGRAAYRLSVRGRHAQSELLTLGLPTVATVDAETGRLLWLTCYGRGRPALRWELRDVAEAGPDSTSDSDSRSAGSDFEFTVPPGLRIVRAGTADDRPAWPSAAWRRPHQS